MRSRHVISLTLAIGLLTAACGGAVANDGAQPDEDETTETTQAEGFIVQDGDTVEVHYIGTLDDGSEFDSSRSAERGPFAFTVGTGQVIAGFDEAVRGGKAGDVRTVHIEPANAYGEWSEDNVVEFPVDPEQGDLKAGDQVMLTSGQPAVVLQVTNEIVRIDANHALAGKALTFEIEILAITRG
jgi:FKBP-type peptidyl-prolyl cis-trans isomerase 2